MQNSLQFGMIYLTTALYAEAKPLLEHWSFKRDKLLPHRLYCNDEICLLVTQMGMHHAARATGALMQHRPPKEGDLLINIGLCAAPESYPLGTALLASDLHYENSTVKLPIQQYIDMPTTPLQTVVAPVSTVQKHAVDMEAYAIYETAATHFLPSHIAFLKIVSDHFEPATIDKERAIASIKENISTLEKLISAIQGRTYE